MKRVPTLGLGGAALAAAVAIAGCGGGSSGAGSGSAYATPASATTGSAGAKVATRHTKLGNVLVDGRGRTLYLFEKDKGTASTCYGACASVWPPLTTGAKAKASGLARRSPRHHPAQGRQDRGHRRGPPALHVRRRRARVT